MALGEKTGGRQKGTPNRERRELLELLQEKYPGYDPVIAMAEIAHTTENETLRFQAHREVAKYTRPRLKTVNVVLESDAANCPVIIDWLNDDPDLKDAPQLAPNT